MGGVSHSVKTKLLIRLANLDKDSLFIGCEESQFTLIEMGLKVDIKMVGIGEYDTFYDLLKGLEIYGVNVYIDNIGMLVKEKIDITKLNIPSWMVCTFQQGIKTK